MSSRSWNITSGFLFTALLWTAGDLAAEILPEIPVAQQDAVKQAKECFEKGDYRAAEKFFERILTAAPDNLYVLSNLGVLRFRSGKYKQAAETLQRAIVVAPNDAFCHYTLGIVQYTQSRLDEAIASLRRAIELNPRNASAHDYLGRAYASRGMKSEAAAELKIARQLNPDHDYPDPEKLPKEIPKKYRLNES